jgi:succinate-acetate transporter protein
MTSTVVSMSGPEIETEDPAHRLLARIPSPSILGLYALAAATFIVSARMAHWYGNAQSAMVLFPLVLILGGLAQFYAGAWAFQTSDAVALATHGTWGSFWTAYGILEILYATGRVARPQGAFPELGFWFIVMAAITWAITVASQENKGMMTLLALLATGSTVEAIAELAGVNGLRILAGYLFMASALVAWYVATMLMLRFGRREKARRSIPVSVNESVRAA